MNGTPGSLQICRFCNKLLQMPDPRVQLPQCFLFQQCYCNLKVRQHFRFEERWCTTFLILYGTFQFEVMQFGVVNVPSIFQHMSDSFFINIPLAQAHIDDVDIFLPSLSEYFGLSTVRLWLFKISELKLYVKNCNIPSSPIVAVRHVLT